MMYRFFCLVLLSAIAAVGAERISINSPLDHQMEGINNKLRQVGATSVPIPEIALDSKVKYDGASFLGLDSLRRTADCWQEVKGNVLHFDISYGYGMLTILLPHLEIAGTNMSAYARVRDNSFYLSYTLYLVDEKCHVKLNDMRVEKMGNVEFGASRPEYDGTNLDDLFKSAVIPKMNDIVKSNFAQIEASLHRLCNAVDYPNAKLTEELAKSFLERLFY